MLLSATLQYLHCDRTRGRVWFAPKLELSQTSLQIQLTWGQIALPVLTLQLSSVHGAMGWSSCLIQVQDAWSWSPFSAPTARIQPPSSTDSCSDFCFVGFVSLSNPFMIWGCTLKNHKAVPYAEVWGPKSHTEAEGTVSEGTVLHRACQDHLPSASGETRVNKSGFECPSSVCTWKNTHNENGFHQSSFQQLLKTA